LKFYAASSSPKGGEPQQPAQTKKAKQGATGMSLLASIEQQEKETHAAIQAASSTAELDEVRVRVLGKKGSLTALLRGMAEVAPEERVTIGTAVNVARDSLEAALAARKTTLESAALTQRIEAEALDISLPGRAHPLGTQHLINRLTEEIVEVFRGIGYSVVEGTEVELDYYNFTALNYTDDHPARGMQDTFYVVDRSGDVAAVQGESDVMLRTQTSGAQVHAMEEQKPPIYVLSPGRVFRRDVADPSHLPQFTQIEGLVVDKSITFGDLKGTLDFFCKQIFGPERKTRFRPHYFPFTEPSAEVDVSCGICNGEGCRFCKGTGWLEILGCGMVDPNVFGFVNIDPEEYSGFAFGMGVERIACLKYNVPDLRMLLEGDMRFLRQF
jgi:phenylalanyl-tRNA synthetase alpha chain